MFELKRALFEVKSHVDAPRSSATVTKPPAITDSRYAGGFPTVALDRGASSFATALHIRERYAKYSNSFGLCFLVQYNLQSPRHL